MPDIDPDDAASGRLAPDPLAGENQPPDNLTPGRSDVTRH